MLRSHKHTLARAGASNSMLAITRVSVWATMAMCTDMLFTCTAERVAEVLTRRGLPVYRYLFGRAPGPFAIDKCLGTPHTSETFFLFSKAFPKQVRSYVVGGADNEALAESMVSAFGQFVHTGAPGMDWPKWLDRQILVFGSPKNANISRIQSYHNTKCEVIGEYIHY